MGLGEAHNFPSPAEALPLHIAICDDDPVFSRLLVSKIRDFFAAADRQCRIEVFGSPKLLLAADLSGCQIAFLDIDMPEMDGLTAARQIRRTNREIFLVFVTAYMQYAREGYLVNAFRYLLKQQLEEELRQCLEDILARLAASTNHITLPTRQGPVDLLLRNILYFEGSAYRMVLVHTAGGQVLSCRGKLGELEETLSDRGFLRLQKSYLANMEHISHLKNYYAFLDNGEELKMSERSFSAINRRFAFWKGQHL